MAADPERARAFTIPGWCTPLVLLVTIAALIVLIAGWGAGVDAAVRIWPGFAAMVPTTALLFAVTSLSLLYPHWREKAAVTRRAALFTLGLASVGLGVAIVGGSLDAVLWPGLGEFGADRMAVATALCFVLLATAMLTLPGTDRRREQAFIGAATAGWLLSVTALVGYLFDAEALYAVSLFTAMALHTAFSFFVLFTAVLLARPDRGWVRTLMGPGEGSAGARRLMPLVVGAPMLLAFLVLLGTRAGMYEADFQLSLLAIVTVVLLGANVLQNAAIQNRTQQEIQRRLQRLSEDNQVLLQEVYHRVKNNLQLINALIRLESPALPKDQRGALHALSSRIDALAKVHKLLLASHSISTLNLASLLDDLCRGIGHAAGAEKRNIEIRVEAADRPVKVDTAIAVGLLVNELVTNALKHAFPGCDRGAVRVLLKTAQDGSARLTVQDNGCGLEAEQRAGKEGTAGARIIRGLIRQLEGSIRVSTEQGTCVEVNIPAHVLG